MKTLLIVYHSMTGGTRQMAEALVKSRRGPIPGRSSAVVLFEGQGAAQLTWLLLQLSRS